MGTPLAAFSYTLYLTHYPVLSLLGSIFPGQARQVTLGTVSTFFLELGLCLASAWIMYFFFERNTGRIRRWLARNYS